MFLVLRFIPKQMLPCALIDIHIRKRQGPWPRDCHELGHTGWHPWASPVESSEVPRQVWPSTYPLNAGVHCPFIVISSVQFSRVQLSVTPWTAACQASLSITNSWSLLKLMATESVMPSNHPLLTLSPPTFNLSQHQGLFQWVSSSNQVAKVLEFQLQHQSFQWIFRTGIFIIGKLNIRFPDNEEIKMTSIFRKS